MRSKAVLLLLPLLAACDDSSKTCRDTLDQLRAEMAKKESNDASLTFNSSTLKAERAEGGTNCVGSCRDPG